MSELKLNLPEEYEKFKEFYSEERNVQMPKLINSGRVPLDTVGLMKRRIAMHGADVSKVVADAWWENYFDTSDGVLYHPDGNIKVIRNAAFLRDMTPDTSLIESGIRIGEDQEESVALYNAADGAQFTREQVKADKFGTVWLTLAGGDKAILDEYKNVVKLELKAREDDYEGEIMKVYLFEERIALNGRWWCIDGINLNSDADGGKYLGNYHNRFIGYSEPKEQLEKTMR